MKCLACWSFCLEMPGQPRARSNSLSTALIQMGEDKPKKKHTERDEKTLDDAQVVTSAEKEKKKKKKRSEKVEKAEKLDEDENMAPRKSKKRKHSEAESDETEIQPKKKKHKNKTGFLDPAEDPSLSEQARRALEYAFTQFRHPKRWKFHKARQNWLIRNVWSTSAVPDTHMPLVSKYLAGVQGGVRENLVKTCRSHVTEAGESAPNDESPQGTSEQALPESKLKELRARVILCVLEATSS
ncbi:uncharacterized protein EV420DRAFT_447341 [Desarmillaria tabescens]|uniref:WKF domain-containing protein n=1 Tax=Armillaria tabescens TaxID=1929756 RepID=A0AA39TW28_ARMTA|nr:uncharacterized protein EV420DRAFT_447341 [Desarmillaria tabescens]KAK0468118.1 hypothetical protein EV420DRAFT_447341 [Desarmillaria tabescens]